MNQLKTILTSKKTRYGTFSTLTAMLVIGVLVVVNVVVTQLDVKFDLTSEGLYSINEQTKKVLASLDSDVTIYPLFKTGAEEKIFMESLNQYAAQSPHIKIEQKDPYIYAPFVDQYKTEDEAIAVNSIIVECGDRFRVIPASKLVTYSMYDGTLQSIDIEPRVTNAIQYVTQRSTPAAYVMTGHNELPMPEGMADVLSEANYAVDTTELLLSPEVPADCAVLIITTPLRDYSPEEARKVLDYLQAGGRAMFMIDRTAAELPNLSSILEAYGVAYNNAYVYEANANRVLMGAGIFYPVMSTHGINTSIYAKNYNPLTANTQGVAVLEVKKNSIKIETVLSSTNESFGKHNAQSQSQNKEAGDLDGPFTVVAAVTDSVYIVDKSVTTKLIVSGTSLMLDDMLNQYSLGVNGEFIVNSLNWLTDRTDEDTVYIPSKMFSTDWNLTLTAQQSLNIRILAMGVIPGLTIALGLVMWLRRRNK